MIDSEFIIKYTNGLYSVPAEDAPRYDEFRDMFSSGQIRSKEWLIDTMADLFDITISSNVVIVGAWFGTLGILMKNFFTELNINMLDIDPRCEKFIHKLIYSDPTLKCTTADMYAYKYTEDIVINTSCEHISNIAEWINLLPKGTTVVLQSNNYYAGDGHVNCVNSKEEFIEKTGLDNILCVRELVLPMYTRYMIIGKT